jgi:hypothetical protein
MWGFKGFPIFDSNLARWALAAEDICFKNSLLSYFFRIGIFFSLLIFVLNCLLCLLVLEFSLFHFLFFNLSYVYENQLQFSVLLLVQTLAAAETISLESAKIGQAMFCSIFSCGCDINPCF